MQYARMQGTYAEGDKSPPPLESVLPLVCMPHRKDLEKERDNEGSIRLLELQLLSIDLVHSTSLIVRNSYQKTRRRAVTVVRYSVRRAIHRC